MRRSRGNRDDRWRPDYCGAIGDEIYRRLFFFEGNRVVDITIDNQIVLAGSNELCHESMRLPRKSHLLLRHQTPQKARGLGFSPEIDEPGEQIMRLQIHDHTIFPPWPEKVFVTLGNLARLHPVGVVDDRHANGIDPRPISFRVYKPFAQKRNHRALVAREDLFFDQLGTIPTGHGHHVSLVDAGTILRRNFVEDARPAETDKRHFDKWIALVESVKDLLRIAQIRGGIKRHRAFLLRVFEQNSLAFLRW